jgi:hypothetical protein
LVKWGLCFSKSNNWHLLRLLPQWLFPRMIKRIFLIMSFLVHWCYLSTDLTLKMILRSHLGVWLISSVWPLRDMSSVVTMRVSAHVLFYLYSLTISVYFGNH